MPQIDKYTAGTVTLTNGSATVTGSSTNWISGGLYSAVAGHWFRYGTFTSLIVTVNSATSITLAQPYSGSTASGLSYEIFRYTRLETPEAVGFLQSLLAKGTSANPFTRVDLDSGSIRASFRDDGTGRVGWYVGASGSADGSQVKAVTMDSVGRLGFGTNPVTGNTLTIGGPMLVNSALSLGSAASSGQIANPLGDSIGRVLDMDFSTLTTAAASIRIFRSTNTTGLKSVQFFRGDNTSTLDHELRIGTAGTLVTLARNGGNVGIGTDAPAAQAEIRGAGQSAAGFTTSGTPQATLSLRDSNTAAGSGGAVMFGASQGYFAAIKGQIGNGGSNTAGEISLQTRTDIADSTLSAKLVIGALHVYAGADNTQAFGLSSRRWSVIYAGTGTINTSDAREKTPVRPLNAAELRAAQRLAMEIGVYQWLEAVKEKGDAARQHVGMTVQRAIEIMEEEGLDPWAYGFMCRDQITRRVKVMQKRMVQKVEEVEVSYTEIEIREGVPVQVTKTRTDKRPVMQMVAVVDEKGKPVLREIVPEEGKAEAETSKKGKRAKPAMEPVMHSAPVMVEEEVEVEIDEPAGDRLGFRPDQIDRLTIRGVAETNADLSARMAAALDRIADLEQKIALLEGK